MTSLSNLAPFALLDVLLVAVAVAWLALGVRDLLRAPESDARRAGSIVIRTLIWSSAFYLLFVAMWGFNYRASTAARRAAVRRNPP